MRGVKSEDLKTILDFLYYGEANVLQVNLDVFLAIASDLKLTGLTDGDEWQTFPTDSPKPDTKKITTVQNIPSTASLYNEKSQIKQISTYKMNMEATSMAKLDDIHGHFAELDQMVKSMMEKSQKVMPIVHKRKKANSKYLQSLWKRRTNSGNKRSY